MAGVQGAGPLAFLTPELHAALAAVDAAGAVIRPYFRAGLAAERKGDDSPVTLADRQAELAMRQVLSAAFPLHGLHGEEFGLENPGASHRWVLDPIDGTRAFITGRPIFGTLISLLSDGVPMLGIIDQPVTGERWIGQAGLPTLFHGRFGGAPQTRRGIGLGETELSCTSPAMLGKHMPAWQQLADRAGRVTWGGDCYAYGLLALGQIDVVAECDLKIWDWAALLPVIEGAGGCLCDWAGAALTPDSDGRVVAVGDPALLPDIVGLLTGSR